MKIFIIICLALLWGFFCGYVIDISVIDNYNIAILASFLGGGTIGLVISILFDKFKKIK